MGTIDDLRKLFNPESESLRLTQQAKFEEIKAASHELNDVVNLRVNTALKDEFSRICKDNQSTISRELKRFMLSIVERGKI